MAVASDSPAFEARHLVKRFGRVSVVRDVNLELEPARCHVLFGRNGAGKSTLIGLAATLLKPSSGELFYGGRPYEELQEMVRHRIGVVSHRTFVYPELTVEENLDFYGRLYGTSGDLEDILAFADLEMRRNTKARYLSRGMAQRLAIARALIHRPSLLLLDEPFTGLDPMSTERLADRIRSVRSDTCVLLTTHDIELGVSLADRILIMEAGRLAFDATGASSQEVRRVLMDIREIAK